MCMYVCFIAWGYDARTVLQKSKRVCFSRDTADLADFTSSCVHTVCTLNLAQPPLAILSILEVPS